MVWSFFGSGHGKGVHDGAGAILKQSIRKEQMKMETPKLHNAADVVAFCKSRQTSEAVVRNGLKDYRIARRDVVRFFHLIENVDRRHKYDCRYFEGVRSLHSLVSVSHRDITLLKVRHLACFCKECMDDNSELCLQTSHVKEWKLVTLSPKVLTEVLYYTNPIFLFILCGSRILIKWA